MAWPSTSFRLRRSSNTRSNRADMNASRSVALICLTSKPPWMMIFTSLSVNVFLLFWIFQRKRHEKKRNTLFCHENVLRLWVQPSDSPLGTRARPHGIIYLGLTLCIRTNYTLTIPFSMKLLLIYHKSLSLSSKLNLYFLTSFITNPKFTQPFPSIHNFHGAQKG